MTLDNLLLNPKTSKLLASYLKKPSHGLLITGSSGSGLNHLARSLAAELLKVTADKLDDHPYFWVVERPADRQEISIDAVRSVIQKLSLRVPSKDTINRVILIKEAHLLSHPAQNTILKILEEPPAGTVFILTSEQPSQLSPTIRSRAQKVTVLPADLDAALSYYQPSYAEPAITSAWQLSQGAVGLLAAILDQDTEHPLKEAVESAKGILQQTTYERLLTLDRLAKTPVDLQATLDGLARVLAALHHSALEKDKTQTRLLNARKQVAQARADLANNVSAKLVATNLALRLPKLF